MSKGLKDFNQSEQQKDKGDGSSSHSKSGSSTFLQIFGTNSLYYRV